MRELELAGDLTNGKCLPLRHIEPARARLEPLTTSRARPGLEPDHDPDPRSRYPEGEQLRRRLAVAHAKPARTVDRPVTPDEIRVCVVLEHQIRHGADRPPPCRGVAAGEGLAGHEQRRPAATRGEAADEAKHVRAIAVGGRRQRSRQRCTPELVERDQRRLATGDGDCVVEERVGALLDERRIHRIARRADALVQMHVPMDGAGSGRARFRREVRPSGGDHHARSSEALAPEGHRAVGEVDPGGLSLGQAARERRRARAGPREDGDDGRDNDQECPAHGDQR